MTGRAPRLAILIAIGIALVGARAQAQAVHQKPAFSIERFTPMPGAAAFIGADDPDVLPAGAWTLSTSTWWAARPIVLRDVRTGDPATVPVAWRAGLELAAARGFGARYQLGLAMPLALQGGDRLAGIGLSDRALQRAVAGDLRLAGKARLAGDPGEPGWASSVAAVVVVPTGDDGDFAGEEGAVFEWHLAAGWRGRRAALAINGGARIRQKEVVLLSPARPHGNELIGAIAGEAVVPYVGRWLGGPDRLWVTGEVAGVLGDAIGKGARGPSPVEARVGARVRLCAWWSVTAAIGAGLTPDEVGAPSWRAILSVTHDRAARGDWDGDGVDDQRDRCPVDPEDRDGYDDADGCPDLDDDSDGIPDVDDQCPHAAEDRDGWHDADGCPDDEQRFPGATPDRAD
ncbi:MAG: hypothetical protein K8W52_41620 [Deltaproteobacteria bacterium]|nr:hypothetical protein [Deltaproteobacteria bacterium]